MLKLNNTIKVMVPTKDNNGKTINYRAMVQGITKRVGGSTMYDAQGLWVSNDKTYKDNNKLVEFNVNDSHAYNTLVEVMGDIVAPLLHKGGQLSVWLQVNGTTFILDSDTGKDFTEVAKELHI